MRAYRPHEVYYPGEGRGAVPFPEEPRGLRGWWLRLRCVERWPGFREHEWMPVGFADWRCKHCGCWR